MIEIESNEKEISALFGMLNIVKIKESTSTKVTLTSSTKFPFLMTGAFLQVLKKPFVDTTEEEYDEMFAGEVCTACCFPACFFLFWLAFCTTIYLEL